MPVYEYKVIPAPRRGKRAKGVKGEAARFAHAITEAMNLQAAEGWEYFKSEALPMDAKSGMFSGTTEAFQTLLVFRRSIEDDTSGDILSVIPAAAPAAAAVATEDLSDDRDPPVRGDQDEDAATLMDEIEDEVSFDEDEIDPLKTLVEDHRKTSSE